MKNQNAARVAINITATGTTMAGTIVLRFEPDLLLFEALDAVEEALLVAVARDWEEEEDASAAETSEL